MIPNLEINQDDLKTLYAHTRAAYGKLNFENWCTECKKSYMSYFNNKELFFNHQYTYSQFVNAQITAIY